jgi:8-oxo-dGTP diphosphatase
VRFGETVWDAVVREVQEETGLRVRPLKLLGVFDVISEKGEYHFVHVVFQCKLIEGNIRASSDALNVAWLNLDKVNKIEPHLKEILRATGFLKR